MSSDMKTYLYLYILVINALSYFVIAYDKSLSQKGRWRVSEKRFLLLAFIGGALGIYLGMKKFRHKTKKFIFIYGTPFFVLLNFTLYYLLFNKL